MYAFLLMRFVFIIGESSQAFAQIGSGKTDFYSNIAIKKPRYFYSINQKGTRSIVIQSSSLLGENGKGGINAMMNEVKDDEIYVADKYLRGSIKPFFFFLSQKYNLAYKKKIVPPDQYERYTSSDLYIMFQVFRI